jgi:hypothetical protein
MKVAQEQFNSGALKPAPFAGFGGTAESGCGKSAGAKTKAQRLKPIFLTNGTTEVVP